MAMTAARRLVGRFLLVVQVALALVICSLVVWLAMRPTLKHLWDVTASARYTVDPSTRELLAEIRAAYTKDEKRSLELHTIYATIPGADARERMSQEELAAWSIVETVQGLTTDLLRQYAYLGGDAVKVIHHDPVREIARTREFVKSVGLKNENVAVVKFGARTKTLSLDMDIADVEVPDPKAGGVPGGPRIPLLKSFKGEEAISSAIKSLLVEGKPRAYFVTGYGEPPLGEARADSYSELASALQREDFEVLQLPLEKLALAGGIPEDAAVVAMMEPRREPSPRAIDALSDYVHRGGRLLLNLSFMESPPDWNPAFELFGNRFGFAIGQDLICTGQQDPRRPNTVTGGTPQVRMLTISELSPVHEVTRPLLRAGRTVYLMDAREITALAAPPAGVRVDTSLLMASPNSWLEPRDANGNVAFAPNLPAERERFQRRSVGALVEVVPQGQKPDSRPGRIALLSGIAFVNRAMGSNGDLGINLFQWLAERKQLVTIRGTRYQSSSMKHVTAIQYGRASALMIYWVPGGLLGLALFVLWWRARS